MSETKSRAIAAILHILTHDPGVASTFNTLPSSHVDGLDRVPRTAVCKNCGAEWVPKPGKNRFAQYCSPGCSPRGKKKG